MKSPRLLRMVLFKPPFFQIASQKVGTGMSLEGQVASEVKWICREVYSIFFLFFPTSPTSTLF